ncbi:MAG: putative pre6S rRNA nuclease [Solirubrobacteraceae bacterium]|jgi:putative Holliday junction resolvase|nr:putative pre6S rRNA nuclease [Solirubrobacteraceae bacterium]
MRALALDYGAARCGVALSDPTGTLATPLDAVVRPDSDTGVGAIADLVRDRGVEAVVVGLPLTLAGDESAQTKEARAFAERLRTAVAVPVELYDERLTTAQARRTGGAASEDSRAAAHLLEAWLAARQARGGTGREGG